MATTTHAIAVDNTAYVNVSNGNLNASLIIGAQRGAQKLRVIVGGTEPVANTEDYVIMQGRADGRAVMLTVTELEAETDVWVCNANEGETIVQVIRGPAKILLMDVE